MSKVKTLTLAFALIFLVLLCYQVLTGTGSGVTYREIPCSEIEGMAIRVFGNSADDFGICRCVRSTERKVVRFLYFIIHLNISVFAFISILFKQSKINLILMAGFACERALGFYTFDDKIINDYNFQYCLVLGNSASATKNSASIDKYKFLSFPHKESKSSKLKPTIFLCKLSL
ncbi:hypothetical protein DICPUDRAFT_76918 [Dictyostelium purpureum]|uniref:Uncharacterized protein n=1 Tax=Dictyostelium purpureum TaxID=5786 RepID=F0ZF19_DICPU|nr:uncharacterized protein DICPUDRAFT_76918 [Dictyostelium purpureum]EGC37445.1 hypothetical protein DICPUDRAFT_76918 [Dictyostelium purpureum]|eukprot:XP_003286009.1 hypothetical protein DICPUDRAFT_76918 [Dictyostelium purpureum]